ncbi:MAG: SRPBCC family protein [Chloroflexi bacterium]|nr:SRPBCC family protein [Chloroflexota bacterium]
MPFAPEQLWPFVADTNRLDRAVGLPPVHVTRVERQEGGEAQQGEYRVLGLPLARWTEHPFEWEWPRRFSVVREYQRGPLVRFWGGTELLPVAGGTRLRVVAHFTPRSALFDPLVRFGIAPRSVGRACRQYQAIAAFLAGQVADPFPNLARARSQADTARLDALVARLRAEGAAPEPTAQLRRLLAEAADEDVAGMRPLELAERWGTDPQRSLETFLHATVAGLLEMRWELLCPVCRGVKAAAAHLHEVPVAGRCAACNLHFTPSADEAIEARFYPAPAIRTVELGAYCVSSPAHTPHRRAQVTLPPGGTREWQLALVPGPYAIRSPQSRGLVRLRAESAGAPALLEVGVESMAMLPEQAQVAAGGLTLRLANATAHAVTVALDDARWSEAAATPGRLMVFPAFRQLFSNEALAPGIELAIGRVGLLFTDLAGSTALYERAGDARAFRLVSDHFAVLRRAIEAAGGAVVKTIGDAVMAAFPDGRAALAAALALQRDIRTLDDGGLVDPARLVKVGVHVGACFAVTLNERLDYFGTAVNLAARAQHEAQGGEIVATATAFDDAADLVAAAGLHGQPFEVQPKGLSAPVRMYRVVVREA